MNGYEGRSPSRLSQDKLEKATQKELEKFQKYYVWLENEMPNLFFEEVSHENMLMITHNLMGFHLQDYFSMINLKHAAIVLCLDSPDADLRVLKNYAMYGIKNYLAFVSKNPLPDSQAYLRVSVIHFTEASEKNKKPLSPQKRNELFFMMQKQNPAIDEPAFNHLIDRINTRFLNALSLEKLTLALQMYFRSQTRDDCQYELIYEKDWENKTDATSLQIVLAWRNTPKHNFLYRLARTIHRHQIAIKRVNATYVDPYKKNSTLIMVLSLHGIGNQAVWDVANIPEFIRELITVKYFASFDQIDEHLISKGVISGNEGNILRAVVNFTHQALVHVDHNLYTLANIEEALCQQPELTKRLCDTFKWKFHPDFHQYDKYLSVREEFLKDVDKLDTGEEEYDLRQKNVLKQGMNMIHHVLKTNAYRFNYSSLSFRLDPKYLDELPFDRTKKFPELPYAIFFIKGMHFFGFHIRFKDLARGGLRTVIPERSERVLFEQNTVFTECYHLAHTQHMKNKDIPEGGSKGIIFLKPYDIVKSEGAILKRELEETYLELAHIEEQLQAFQEEQRLENLHQAQRSFVDSLLVLVNCEPNGTLRAGQIVDYWKRPEYLYLGPDENMHDEIIEWIANQSKKYQYKPLGSFISSKPTMGINHKEYGVTSLGVNVYMHEMLRFIGIDPFVNTFTVKMSGGPDGDVAGNQILNLYRYYPKTAFLLALTDISGTIYDPNGLDLQVLADLFHQSKPIRFYPREKLSEGGFLVDKETKKQTSIHILQTLCLKRHHGELKEEWLSGSEMNQLLRNNMHQTKTDVFIPSGGRPRTLNEGNIKEFLDASGEPTSKVIIEGANLYISPNGRRILEDLDTRIIKDSSANKTGVICSSFEVLCGLTLNDELFLAHKNALVQEILDRLKKCALQEVTLILKTHRETKGSLIEISNKISERINLFTYQLLDYLDPLPLPNDPHDPLIQCFLSYCLPTLRKHFQTNLLENVPEHHKKAIISCHIGAQLVYQKGLRWFPSIVEILPLALKEVQQNF